MGLMHRCQLYAHFFSSSTNSIPTHWILFLTWNKCIDRLPISRFPDTKSIDRFPTAEAVYTLLSSLAWTAELLLLVLRDSSVRPGTLWLLNQG